MSINLEWKTSYMVFCRYRSITDPIEHRKNDDSKKGEKQSPQLTYVGNEEKGINGPSFFPSNGNHDLYSSLEYNGLGWWFQRGPNPYLCTFLNDYQTIIIVCPQEGYSSSQIEEYLESYLYKNIHRNFYQLTTQNPPKKPSNNVASWTRMKSKHNNFVKLLLYPNFNYVSRA